MWFHRENDVRQHRYLCGLISVYLCKRHRGLTAVKSYCTDKNIRDVDGKNIFWKLPKKQIIGCLVIATVTGSIIFVTYQALTLHRRLRITDNAHETERRVAFIYPQHKHPHHLDDSYMKDFGQVVAQSVEKIRRGIIPWAQSKTKDPRLLLRLVESEDANTRRWGLRALIVDNEWEDYQYRMVAQGCSNRTLVSLARSPYFNDRFFRRLPRLLPTKESIESSIQNLLVALQKDVTDNGIRQFTGKVLSSGEPKNIIKTVQWNFDDSLLPLEKLELDDKDERSLIYLLQALVSHTSAAYQRVKLFEYGGLLLVLRIYLQYSDNVVVCRLIAWILANLALDVNLHKAIIDGGWVTILHEWLNSSDTALLFHTARALANLDRDFEPGFDVQAFYDEGIYLAHPVHKTLTRKNRVKADIVFIHGLMGGPFKTWREKDRDPTQTEDDRHEHTYFWPKDWLAKDVPNVRILNVGYQTELTKWDTMHPVEPEKRTIVSRSSDLLEKLRKADIGNRPVILVGHSMGGLLIKEMLRVAATDSRYSSIVENTIGVMFYSVPHHGSSLAKMGNQAKYMIFPSVEVQELDKDNADLKELHKSFLDLHETFDIPVLSFGETQKTRVTMNMKVLFVPPESSDPGCGEFHVVPTDHISVCKPQDTSSDLYQRSLSFIRRCLFHSTVKQTVAKAKQKLDIGSDL